MPVIQKKLDDLLEQWNDHYVSQSRQAPCPAGRPNIIHQLSSETGFKHYIHFNVFIRFKLCFMPLKPLFDCVINLGGVDCLTKTTEEDEAWLETFQRSISRSGLGAYDLYAHEQFLSNNWTNAKEWKEAMFQYSQLKE